MERENENIINLEINKVPSDTRIQKQPILDGELTGYASIDKPWLKYYSKDVIDSDLPQSTIYRYIYENNKKYLDRKALNYYGNKISYRKMFENIDKVASILVEAGVKKGDIVSISMPTVPETVYLFYALSKIGAISNMIDPRKSLEEMTEYINMVDSKFLFIISVAAQKVAKIKEKTNIKEVVTISPADSLPFYLNYPMQLKEKVNEIVHFSKDKKTTDFINWTEFLSKPESTRTDIEIVYEKDLPVSIVYTGGTTGISKGVVLSNDNINAASFQCENCGFDFQRQHKWLNIMPPFIAYGVGNGLHLPLACGMEVTLIPQFDPKKFDRLLLKHKPNHMTGVPTHYDSILQSKKIKKTSLKFIYSAIVGGDKLAEETEEKINVFFDNHDCNYKIAKGYGLSEVMAAVCATSKNKVNEVGSVGIPFSHTTIAIFDFDTNEELKYNEIGEVCITGPNTMLRYYNNQSETDNIIRKHQDDKMWVHSGDIGYITSDGKIFLLGRRKEMIIRHDGFKVYPILIENVIMSHPDVESCKVVGVPDSNFSQGELPKAHIVLKQNHTKDDNIILNEIKHICSEELAEYLIPCQYNIRESLPKTPIGKIDFMALKSEDTKEKIKIKKN